MWNRSDLKAGGKFKFQQNYWKCVLVSLVLALATGAAGTAASSKSRNHVTITNSHSSMHTYSRGVHIEWPGNFGGFSLNFGNGFLIGIVMLIVVLIAVAISLLLKILVFNPLEMGGCRFYIENAFYPSNPGRLGFAFKSGCYGNTVKTLFFRDLYLVLWSLLFVIPGIVKAYEYRMVPYLLADAPDMSREDAFRISRQMMDGNKLDTFILDLSFIGWEILSGLTLGILGIFYVNPYVDATNAELFLVLKQQYFSYQN